MSGKHRHPKNKRQTQESAEDDGRARQQDYKKESRGYPRRPQGNQARTSLIQEESPDGLKTIIEKRMKGNEEEENLELDGDHLRDQGQKDKKPEDRTFCRTRRLGGHIDLMANNNSYDHLNNE